MRKLIPATISALALALGFAGPSAAEHLGPGFISGAVFVATNSTDQAGAFPRGNEIVMYRMDRDGALTLRGRFPTGGQGAGPGTLFRGDALGAGNSVVLSGNQKFLFAVNAGSDEISFFHLSPEGLTLIDHVDSGGSFPTSVTQRGRLLYVLNSGGDGNIMGFEIIGGHLVRLPDSTRGLNAGGTPGEVPNILKSPAQVSFTPDGKFLVVTIKDAAPRLSKTGTEMGQFLVFPLDPNGIPSADPVITTVGGVVPFGFTFDGLGRMVVVEASGGAGGTGAVSSYRINDDGTLKSISQSIGNNQVDSCWNAIGGGGKFLYTANFGSNTISSYAIGTDGSLRLLEEVAAKTEKPDSFNLDLRASTDGMHLYNVLPGVGRVAGWNVEPDGTLTRFGEFDGLEPSPKTEPPEPFGPGGSPAGLAVAIF